MSLSPAKSIDLAASTGDCPRQITATSRKERNRRELLACVPKLIIDRDEEETEWEILMIMIFLESLYMKNGLGVICEEKTFDGKKSDPQTINLANSVTKSNQE